MQKGSGGFCCQVPPNPACRSLTRQGFKFDSSNRVTQPEQPEHSCHSQLHVWPDIGGTMPSKSPPFTPSSTSTPVAVETASNHPAPPWSPAEPGWPAATLPSDHPSGQAASACRWSPKSPASETIAASRNRLTIPYSLGLTPPKCPVRPPDCLALAHA